jgi:diaminopimelate decarboxylase
MNHFELRAGDLYCEDVALAAIAAGVGTPAYVYSTATLERHFAVFAAALSASLEGDAPLIAYAVKANSNLSVLRTLGALGAGADTVSEGEIRRALAAGIPADRIVFSGVGKTRCEIAFALQTGVRQINVESEPELALISMVAAERGVRPRLALRVNPDVGAGGHAKISTGGSASKFGADPAVRMSGLACHIGSQITDLDAFATAFGRMRALVEGLRADGLALDSLDLGGGLGVPYFHQPDPPDPAAFAAVAARAVAGLDVALIFEPGRVLIANAGVLLAAVIHVNERADGHRFLVLDAAMNDLLRPAMYDAWHDVRAVRPRPGPERAFDIVGPVCESGDTFARDRRLPPMQAGDLVAFFSAGAYGAAMASEYNSRRLVPEVLVRGSEFAVVRGRPTYEDMLARDQIAPWL